MTAVLVVACFIGAVYVAHGWLANLDDAEREQSLDDIIARRYAQPIRLGVWNDDTFSTATSVRDATYMARSYGAEVAVDPLAASGCNSEQTAHAADLRLQARSVAHAGTEPTPSAFGAPGGVGLLAPSRDTTPHPLTGRRRI